VARVVTGATITLANGLTLSYGAHGAGDDPALVCLPGPIDSWRSYEPVLDQLPPTLRAVAVSARGHGDSDKPANGYAVADYALDVPFVLDALGVERAVLAGHSGSCLVARRVALDRPDRVAGLVLEASPSRLTDDEVLREFVRTVVEALEDPIDPALVRQFVTGTSSEGLPPDLVDRLVTESLEVPARVWRETFAGLLRYDDLAELDHLHAPTLLVWGDADTLVSRDVQDELERHLPRTERIEYAGVGHTPRWEVPARFAADVAAFCGRLRPA
jgi:pimeloyl-ACP methyl ester carboxylesterase